MLKGCPPLKAFCKRGYSIKLSILEQGNSFSGCPTFDVRPKLRQIISKIRYPFNDFLDRPRSAFIEKSRMLFRQQYLKLISHHTRLHLAIKGCNGLALNQIPRSNAKQENPRTGGIGPRVPFAFVTLDWAVLWRPGNRGETRLDRLVPTFLGPVRLPPDERF